MYDRCLICRCSIKPQGSGCKPEPATIGGQRYVKILVIHHAANRTRLLRQSHLCKEKHHNEKYTATPLNGYSHKPCYRLSKTYVCSSIFIHPLFLPTPQSFDWAHDEVPSQEGTPQIPLFLEENHKVWNSLTWTTTQGSFTFKSNLHAVRRCSRWA